MPKKRTVYLDTSVISHLHADDVPYLRSVTEEFFQGYVAKGLYEVFISAVVLREIQNTSDAERRMLLLSTLQQYPMEVLDASEESESLAEKLIEARAIPPKSLADAQHLAIAICNYIDVLLSWNFRHLANLRTQQVVRAVSEANGYFHPLVLTNPMEVMYGQE